MRARVSVCIYAYTGTSAGSDKEVRCGLSSVLNLPPFSPGTPPLIKVFSFLGAALVQSSIFLHFLQVAGIECCCAWCGVMAVGCGCRVPGVGDQVCGGVA